MYGALAYQPTITYTATTPYWEDLPSREPTNTQRIQLNSPNLNDMMNAWYKQLRVKHKKEDKNGQQLFDFMEE